MPKPIAFLGSSLEDLRDFPRVARRESGYQLDKVQSGEEPDDWKPLPAAGRGVSEIRIREESGIYRVLYVVKFPEAVYVLHAFQKKTQQTSMKDIDVARTRYRELIRNRP